MTRYIAGTATGKRFIFSWAESNWCPSNAMNVFALDDDYSMGVLMSSVHGEWAHSQSSTLEDRPRYTPTSCFETYPWPQADRAERNMIGDLARRLSDRRQAVCAENDFGLTRLYNQVDQGAYAEIQTLHDELDRMVVKAYGWPGSTASDADESNRLLLELNTAIATEDVPYSPFS